MQLQRLLGGGDTLVEDVPLMHAAADLVKGALIIKGATPGTHGQHGVVASGACAGLIGLLLELVDASEVTDSTIGGTVQAMGKVCINPDAVYLAEYDQTTTMTGTSVTTTLTIASIEDNIDNGWVFMITSDGTTARGQLRYITAADGSTVTLKTAFANAAAGGSTMIKILPKWHGLVAVNTAADKLATQAAAGAARLVVLRNLFQADGYPLQELDPVKHNGLNGLTNAKFFAELVPSTHIFNPLS